MTVVTPEPKKVPAASRSGYRPAAMGPAAGFTTELRGAQSLSTSFPTQAPNPRVKPMGDGKPMKVRPRKQGTSRGTALTGPVTTHNPALSNKPRAIIVTDGFSIGRANG